jgi:hypothetical protein
MSCYLQHIQDILDEAGIVVTPANRRLVDEAVHKAVGTVYKDCPATWKKIKTEVRDDPARRQALVQELRRGVG